MRKVYIIIAFILIIFSLYCVYSRMPGEGDFIDSGTDEGTYFKYSKSLLDNGISSYPVLFHEHVSNQEHWIWPDPLRVGYFLIANQWLGVFGVSHRALAMLSFVCFILFLLVSLYFSRKFFNKYVSILYVLLLAFSPLAMVMAKRALTDSMGNLFIAVSIWLFLRFLFSPRILNLALFILVYSYSVLIRQQLMLLLIYFALSFLIYKFIYKQPLPMRFFFSIITIPPLVVGVVWLICAQSFSDLVLLIKLLRILPATNQYSVLFCRGPWYKYILDYLLISPVVTILSLAFLVYALANRQVLKDPKVTFFLITAVSVYFLLSSFDYNKNVRYALSIDLCMRILAIFMLKEIFKENKSCGDLVFVCVLALCILDYFNFRSLFWQKDIYFDPISIRLLKLRSFVPVSLIP